ncbi:MAG: glutathione peroxidase [Betaproteobacteria bacterium]|nr:glutathione peroxidase [Betaproteobacteria bacterium]
MKTHILSAPPQSVPQLGPLALRRPRLLRLLASLSLVAMAMPVPAGAATDASGTPTAQTSSTSNSAQCPALLDHRFSRLRDGQAESLCAYSGRVVLVVNTASKCGFTPQYEGLQALHQKYSARGLTVLAFPSGDFLGQEHGNRTDIAKTCFDQYGAQFMVYDKTAVVGRDANPLFVQLRDARGAPRWNFHKYLIGRDGKPGPAFGSTTEPLDAKLISEIEKLLSTPASTKTAALNAH